MTPNTLIRWAGNAFQVIGLGGGIKSVIDGSNAGIGVSSTVLVAGAITEGIADTDLRNDSDATSKTIRGILRSVQIASVGAMAAVDHYARGVGRGLGATGLFLLGAAAWGAEALVVETLMEESDDRRRTGESSRRSSPLRRSHRGSRSPSRALDGSEDGEHDYGRADSGESPRFLRETSIRLESRTHEPADELHIEGGSARHSSRSQHRNQEAERAGSPPHVRAPGPQPPAPAHPAQTRQSARAGEMSGAAGPSTLTGPGTSAPPTGGLRPRQQTGPVNLLPLQSLLVGQIGRGKHRSAPPERL